MLIRNKGLFAALAALCLFTASAGAQTEFVCAGLDTATNIHVAGKSLQPRSTSGSLSALVIFADFEEGTLSAPLPAFATRLFDRERAGSLSHFYDTMSAGQFAVQGAVLPRRYHSNGPASDYVATAVDQRGRYGQFVREILQKADQDIDFGQFDNDGADGIPNSADDDGVVDYIFVNIATTPAWFFVGNATGVGGLGMDDSYESDDLGANGAPIQIFGHSSGGSVLREGNYEQTVGAMAHELGHHLGLPDLFDRSYSSPAEDSAGIGHWGLMAWGTLGWNGTDGPNPFSAWSLEQLGWIGVDNENLVEVSGEHSVSEFSPLVEGGLVYKLATRDPSEYFLVEYRRPGASHYERSLPGDGLLIWHIRQLLSGNTSEQKKRVDLVCADGLFDDGGFPEGRLAGPITGGDNLDFWAHDVDYAGSHSGNLGDATDPFDGVRFREFSPTSNPAALTGIGVFDIRRAGTRLSANLVRDTRHRSGIILADEVWRDSVIVVGDVFVAAQARLTISPGTVVIFETESDGGGLDPERIELVVDGTLIVGDENGTRPVKFTSAAVAPKPGDWHGIIVHFQGVIDMRNAVIEYARDGISGGGWSRVHELESVSIRETSRHGIHLVQMAKSLTLTGLEVSEAGAEGVRIQGTGPTVVRASRFTNNAASGFVRIGGSLQLLHSEFTDNGLGVVDGANLVVAGTVGRVAASQFSGGVGIRVSRSDNLVIEDNLFSRHQIGLLSLDSRPLIEGSSVPVRVALNTVLASDRFLDNRASTEVNAANNWWGFEDEIAIGQRMDGAVEWRPFLNVDPRLPLDLALMQNFPNPFNSGTTIEYTVGSAALKSGYRTVLDIWTVTGGLVRRLVDEPTLPGRHAVAWDGTDQQGHAVASSLYLYRLRVGSYTKTRRLLLLK